MTSMSTAVMIDMRICMMYCRKAVRLPMGISPLSTRKAPRYRTATRLRFMMSMSAGHRDGEEPVERERRGHVVAVGVVEALLLVAACARRRG